MRSAGRLEVDLFAPAGGAPYRPSEQPLGENAQEEKEWRFGA